MARGKDKKTIFQYLQEATKIDKRPKESMNAFKKRMVEAIDDLPEKVWDALPDNVQEFANDAIQQINDDNYISFPGLDDDGPAEEEEEPPKRSRAKVSKEEEVEEEVEEEKPAPRRGRPAKKNQVEDEEESDEKKPVKRGRPPAKKADDEDKAPPKKAGRPKGSTTKNKSDEPRRRTINKDGAVYQIKQVLLDDVDASAEDVEKILSKRMGKEAPKKSTITGIRSDFLNSLYVLQEAGHLKGIDLP